ncbi:MAG: cation-translocating P-type ATPase [Atopobiaceae bacterium]|jgi:Ca2+-transporting ATPase|nr:cation-translocating P-type ATPase [Atopobiaceae bacterium]
MTTNDQDVTRTGEQGLTTEEARRRQERYGRNELAPQKREGFATKLLHILCEPMFLLLIVAAVIYFILGEPRDGAIMLVFVVGIITIDVVQEWKTDKTLAALKDLSAPHVTVIRDGREQDIASVEVVPGDLMMLCEGVKVPADGIVVRCADLCVDESSLTGESLGVWKVPEGMAEPSGDHWHRDWCYAGTLVTQGTATVEVSRIGPETEYGRIGLGVASAPDEPAPLKRQTDRLVRTCAIIAGVLFVLVGVFTWFDLTDHAPVDRLVESVLSGVTLAMAMIPEEFPVILTVFLSMGAWRLAREKTLVRKLPSVETLGAVSVLCVDKTGTITMNRMSVQETWVASGSEHDLLETMGLGCETDTYDPMEKAMLACCDEHGIKRDDLFAGELVREYAFTNELKMMGHVWDRGGSLVIAAKGSPERILGVCDLAPDARADAEGRVEELSSQGLRVIAIAKGEPVDEASVPEDITSCHLTLLGVVGLADPPREGVEADIAECRRAGIRVVMITGDNGVTASAIARRVGIASDGEVITGDELEGMGDDELRKAVRHVSVFSRVIPEHKMRIVKALKENGEVVAMTGDGVNDAPALKYADIGIAMGKRGSEVSREAADLILMDDNFATIVRAVSDGRRIYDNIRKAVGYVFTIHIPIAFSALLGPFLGIAPAALLLLPLHVVLLEVMIDPTCSVVLERQPAERDVMDRPPRDPAEEMLTRGLLARSVAMGLTVFAAAFGSYWVLLSGGADARVARAMGLAVIMLANLFLVQVISSESDSALVSARRLAGDWVMWAVVAGTLALLAAILYSPLSGFLKLAPLTAEQALVALALAAASVLWYEVVKAVRRNGARAS